MAPPAPAAQTSNQGFLYLSDNVQIKDLPTLACGLCYRDALVGRKCSGKCGRPHFASLTAVPAPCGQILRSFIAQTRGVSLTKPSTGGGDGRKRGRDSYDDDRYNDDRRDTHRREGSGGWYDSDRNNDRRREDNSDRRRDDDRSSYDRWERRVGWAPPRRDGQAPAAAGGNCVGGACPPRGQGTNR